MSSASRTGFDRSAAITRSLLGWGVVAGPFYVVFGLILALTRPGFDLTRDALSLLLLGDGGWLQALNLILSGAMTITAAIGLRRTPRWPRMAAALTGIYGLCLLLSAVFPPDPTGSFPPAVPGGSLSVAGVLHLAFGGIGFICLGIAALVSSGWFRRPGHAASARIAGVLILVGFFSGGALSSYPVGVALLWMAVLVAWAWLALTSIDAYREVPHPLLSRR